MYKKYFLWLKNESRYLLNFNWSNKRALPTQMGTGTLPILWSCQTTNIADCMQNGKVEKCSDNSVCFLEMRDRPGTLTMVRSGCKQKKACLNNRHQNNKVIQRFKNKRDHRQCEPDGGRQSVCRECCVGKNCVNCRGEDCEFWSPWNNNRVLAIDNNATLYFSDGSNQSHEEHLMNWDQLIALSNSIGLTTEWSDYVFPSNAQIVKMGLSPS